MIVQAAIGGKIIARSYQSFSKDVYKIHGGGLEIERKNLKKQKRGKASQNNLKSRNTSEAFIGVLKIAKRHNEKIIYNF